MSNKINIPKDQPANSAGKTMLARRFGGWPGMANERCAKHNAEHRARESSTASVGHR